MINKIFLFLLSLIIVMPAIPSFGQNQSDQLIQTDKREQQRKRDEAHFGREPSVRTMSTKKWKKPKKPRVEFDEKSYYLGKDIYEDKIKLSDNLVSEKAFEEQSRTLKKLKKKLPDEVVNNLDKAEYVGRLEIDQMDALIYFLKMRFSKL